MRTLPLFALPIGAACGASPDAAPPAPPATAQAAAPALPAQPALSTATGPVRQTWERLLASGCDLAKVPVWTPIEARVLRNAPYALAGLRFQDNNLRILYEQDGGWYKPTLDAPPPLDASVNACVDKLKAHETQLRESMALPPELEARMTRDHALFVVLREWGSSAENPYANPRFEQDSEGTWTFRASTAGCPPGEECGAYVVSCPSETPCEPVAAG